MRQIVSFVTNTHIRTQRDYMGRILEADKAECAAVAKQWGKDYWDGERKFGYGGYKYDGRWAAVAQKMTEHYQLAPDSKILDVGCGKGFLLYELKKLLPEAGVTGIDISTYGIENSKEEIKGHLKVGHASKLEFDDDEFDFVFSINTIHNLHIFELFSAVKEIQRVSRQDSYICVESYRNEREKMNLLYWQLTCRSFHFVEGWEWIFKENGYTGDYEFIFFE